MSNVKLPSRDEQIALMDGARERADGYVRRWIARPEFRELSERSVMFEVCNAVRATQYALGPVRRAKRTKQREVLGE